MGQVNLFADYKVFIVKNSVNIYSCQPLLRFTNLKKYLTRKKAKVDVQFIDPVFAQHQYSSFSWIAQIWPFWHFWIKLTSKGFKKFQQK